MKLPTSMAPESYGGKIIVCLVRISTANPICDGPNEKEQNQNESCAFGEKVW